MKIIFIEPPPTLDWLPGQKATTAGRRHPSLNYTGELVYSYLNLQSAAVLRQRGHEVLYAHCQTMGLGMAGLRDYLRQHRPDLVVIMLEHITYPVALAAVLMAREEANSKTVFVGPFATALDEDVLRRSGVDLVCRSEWDYLVSDIADAWESGRSLSEIHGLSYMENGQLVRTEDAELIEDLDALPIPAYDLLDLSCFYEAVFKRFPAATMITSRGCPHRCVYCSFPQTIYSRKHRAASPERVVKEIRHLVKDLGVREIRLDDDCFEVDRARAFRICKLLENEKLDLIWSVQCRPGNIDLDLAKAMKKAGCHFILYGIESGNDEILKKIRKGTTVEAMRRGVGAAKKAGIDILNCIMLGFYWDTPETVRQTIEFAKELNAEFTQFSTPTALPGTEYYELLRSEGCLVGESWEEFDSFHHAGVELPNLSTEFLNKTLSGIYKDYYLRPRYVWMMVRRGLRSWDNFVQSLRGALALVRR